MKDPTKLPSGVAPKASVTELRKAITGLGARGTGDVAVVRKAFVDGIAPTQTASSGSVADFVGRFAGDELGSSVVRSTSQFGVYTSVVGTTVQPPRPELDYVEIENDRSFGVLDSFYARIVSSLSADEAARVTHVRILRAQTGRASVPKPAFSAMIDSAPMTAGSKSTEALSNAASRISEIGVGNKLTDFVTDDRFTGQRAVVSSGTMRPLPPSANTNRRSGSPAALVEIANADRSVLENLTFYVNQRTTSLGKPLLQALVVGQREGLNVLQGSSIAGASSIVQEANSEGFYEVARVPVAGGKRIGGFVELEYWDPSVVYGSSYAYYAVSVSADGAEGPRSRIVRVDVSRFIPPPSPTVLYGVIAGTPRFSLSCSGSFIDHIEVFRRGGKPPGTVRALSTKSSMIADVVPTKTDLDFYHVGDVGLGTDRSAVFIDRETSGGDGLEYRFYTVDSFGLKSPTPFSCSIMVPDDGSSIPLPLPSITVQQAIGGRIVDVMVRSDDPKVTAFVIGRRELTSVEKAFRQPSQPDWFNLGVPQNVKRAHSRIGPVLNQTSTKAWTGILVPVSGAARFSDLSVQFDRLYQYSVHAVDVRGNRTSAVASQPIAVNVKPVSDPPVGLSAVVMLDGIEPTGVRLEWTVGTLDFSPNDLVGDQDVLAATSQRTVFQVERREVGKSVWEAMPATTASFFIDSVSQAVAPKFRPSFVRAAAEYDYRVIAMQSGGFLSTYTDPVRVTVSPEAMSPGIIWIRSTSTAVRPLHIAVSWQYDGRFVDGWEIERATANKVFASKILSMDSAEARALDYRQIAEVMRESSRGHGISAQPVVDTKLIVGNRYFIDSNVDMANSYFYRIRSFDFSGKFSTWSYGGISLTDSPHDRKLMSVLSDDEKVALTLDPRPISKWRNG